MYEISFVADPSQCSYWKPSTFGGDVGFEMVKSASLQEKLFCLNIEGECPLVAFRVPAQEARKAMTLSATKSTSKTTPEEL